MNIEFYIEDNRLHSLIFDDEFNVYENNIYQVNKADKNLMSFIKYHYGEILKDGANVYFSNPKEKQFFSKINDTYPEAKFHLIKEIQNKARTYSKSIPSVKFHGEFCNKLTQAMEKEKLLTIESHYAQDIKKTALTISRFDNGRVVFSQNIIKNGNKDLDSKSIANIFKDIKEQHPSIFDKLDYIATFNSTEHIGKKSLSKFLNKEYPDVTINHFPKIKGDDFNYFKKFNLRQAFNKHFDSLSNELMKPEHTVVFIDGGSNNKNSTSSFIISHNNQFQGFSYDCEFKNYYEEVAFLLAMRKVLKSDVFSQNKIHFVCDSDGIEAVFNRLNEKETSNSRSIEKTPLFREVKDLYEDHEEKIYMHYVKSHFLENKYIYFGNDKVDKLNTSALKLSESLINDNYDLSKMSYDYLKPIIQNEDLSQTFLHYISKEQKEDLTTKKIIQNQMPNKDVESYIIIREASPHKLYEIGVVDLSRNMVYETLIQKKAIMPKNLNLSIQDKNIAIIADHEAFDNFVNFLEPSMHNKVFNAKSVGINNLHERRCEILKKQILKLKGKNRTLILNGIKKYLLEGQLLNCDLSQKSNHILTTLNNENENNNENAIQNFIDREQTSKKPIISLSNLDFEKTYGNKELFPLSHELDNDKTYIIMRYGNQNVEIHRIENGEKNVSIYPQDFKNIEYLDKHLTDFPLDQSKPLMLSMPNGFAQRELASTFRGQENIECKNVFNLIRQFNKENLFLTKSSDYSFALIDKDVQWFTSILETSRSIQPPEKKRKQRNKIK